MAWTLPVIFICTLAHSKCAECWMSIVHGASDINNSGDYFRLKNNYILSAFYCFDTGCGILKRNVYFRQIFRSSWRNEPAITYGGKEESEEESLRARQRKKIKKSHKMKPKFAFHYTIQSVQPNELLGCAFRYSRTVCRQLYVSNLLAPACYC